MPLQNHIILFNLTKLAEIKREKHYKIRFDIRRYDKCAWLSEAASHNNKSIHTGSISCVSNSVDSLWISQCTIGLFKVLVNDWTDIQCNMVLLTLLLWPFINPTTTTTATITTTWGGINRAFYDKSTDQCYRIGRLPEENDAPSRHMVLF